jgi:hypothetical protein
MKSGSLNLLGRSGPVQACNGIPLPLHVQTKSEPQLFVKPHGKKPFGNASHRWMYNVKIFFKEGN